MENSKNSKWRQMIRSAMHTNPTFSWNNGDRYKGQKYNNKCYGLGAYYWGDIGSFYFGGWRESKRDGYGITTSGDFDNKSIFNCPECVVYVGFWSNNDKSGQGKCYDKTGRLIYFGKFVNDKPTETYPSIGNYSKFKFEMQKCSEGNVNLVELIDGERNGYGIFLWQYGDMWFGSWSDDRRDGCGIHLFKDGSLTTGKWMDDLYFDLKCFPNIESPEYSEYDPFIILKNTGIKKMVEAALSQASDMLVDWSANKVLTTIGGASVSFLVLDNAIGGIGIKMIKYASHKKSILLIRSMIKHCCIKQEDINEIMIILIICISFDAYDIVQKMDDNSSTSPLKSMGKFGKGLIKGISEGSFETFKSTIWDEVIEESDKNSKYFWERLIKSIYVFLIHIEYYCKIPMSTQLEWLIKNGFEWIGMNSEYTFSTAWKLIHEYKLPNEIKAFGGYTINNIHTNISTHGHYLRNKYTKTTSIEMYLKDMIEKQNKS